MSLKSFILQSLFVLLFCTSFLSAAEDPFTLESHHKLYAYVGFLDYPQDITRLLLVTEAKRVWDYLPQTGGPGMVSALYTPGNRRIYFASSIKGTHNQRDLGFPQILTDALGACNLERDYQGDHVRDARCAELMVIAHWYSENGGGHPDSHVQLPPSGKLIVAVDHNRNVRPPCSEGDGDERHRIPFGCTDVLPKLRFSSAEIVTDDPTNPCHDVPVRRSFGGLRARGCGPKKPTTAKPSPRGKPAPTKPKAQAPLQGKPKPPSNDRPKPANPKMLAKPKAPSNSRPKPAPSKKGPKR